MRLSLSHTQLSLQPDTSMPAFPQLWPRLQYITQCHTPHPHTQAHESAAQAAPGDVRTPALETQGSAPGVEVSVHTCQPHTAPAAVPGHHHASRCLQRPLWWMSIHSHVACNTNQYMCTRRSPVHFMPVTTRGSNGFDTPGPTSGDAASVPQAQQAATGVQPPGPVARCAWRECHHAEVVVGCGGMCAGGQRL